MKLPEFIQKAAERAIHDATHPQGMHTNGKCMVSMEVSQFQRLLMVAMSVEEVRQAAYREGYGAGSDAANDYRGMC
jgi:hypothetical protein